MSETGFHVMAKPAGPLCNLDCTYCFYLEKKHFYPQRQSFLMSDEVLRSYVKQNIQLEKGPQVLFTWQGGEPMLRGLAFFERAVVLQKEHGQGRTIRNTLQTHGLLLDEDWCRFLSREGFEVGISLDGPAFLHDAARLDKQGRPTFERVMQAISLLRTWNIPFNVLFTVTRQVSEHPQEVYQFIQEQGFTHVQFNPVVERLPDTSEQVIGLHFRQPTLSQPSTPSTAVTPHSVRARTYGEFLTHIFDQWVRQDVGRIFVMNFEWALAACMGLDATVCLFSENCGKALVMEHNGDLYSCDHFVYPQHRLGNLTQTSLATLVHSPSQKAFGQAKSERLPVYCQECPYRRACHGECPKNRFIQTPTGEPGLNYLCEGYRHYFRHIAPYLKAMAQLIQVDQPASRIAEVIRGPVAVMDLR